MLALLGIAGCVGQSLNTIYVGPHPVRVEVAHTTKQRTMGLMYRGNLPANQGMLFMYPDEAPRQFWMKNTRIPLSVAFADHDGRILNIATMRPMSTTHTRSASNAQYALEMNQGWFEAHHIQPGDTLRQLPSIAPE